LHFALVLCSPILTTTITLDRLKAEAINLSWNTILKSPEVPGSAIDGGRLSR